MSKTFTLSEAQVLLPVLESLLQTARDARRRVEQADEQLQRVVSRILMMGGMQIHPIRMSALRADRERQVQRLRDALEELNASGVQLKDLDQGLLDFPCVMKGRVVLLCWKLGEESIEHWHGMEEGFAGRKPIDPSLFDDSTSHLH